MTTKRDLPSELYRVVDANLNRLREGIRVIEDIIDIEITTKNSQVS